MSEVYQYQLQPGTILKGRFKIRKAVNFGAFGDIYLAQDLKSDKKIKCAVKQYRPKRSDRTTLQAADRFFSARGTNFKKFAFSSSNPPFYR